MDVSNMTTQLGARMFANPRTGATVHTYVAPPDGLFVTSHLVETEHELTVIDAQFRPEHAAEVKAYADSLSKPIARMIVTHAHPDHFVGAKTFGDIPIHATAEARDFIAQAGPQSSSTTASRRVWRSRRISWLKDRRLSTGSRSNFAS